jgi:hypothetical protein
MDGWIKKSGATPDRSRNPASEPLFRPNVLEVKKNKTEKDRIKKNKKTEKKQKGD